MRYILILLFFVFQLFGSALNNADSLSTPSATTATGVTKQELLKFDVKVPTESSVSAEEQKALQEQKTITKATDFFVSNVTFSSCSASCPIKPEYQTDFYAKVNKFDMNTGAITCSVFSKKKSFSADPWRGGELPYRRPSIRGLPPVGGAVVHGAALALCGACWGGESVLTRVVG